MALKNLFNPEAREYERMAKQHKKLWQWGLAHLKLFSPIDIADLGCGDGRNVSALAQMFPLAKVIGLDLSEVAVRLARERNHAGIVTKRCEIIQGSVVALPFASESLDLATAFETVYFWPGPFESFREVYRVLIPGGLFMIVNKLDGKKPEWADKFDGLEPYDKLTLISLLKAAGFNEFSVDQNEEDWLCLIARK